MKTVSKSVSKSKGTFDERIKYELTKQREHGGKLHKELKNIRETGGLGYSFIVRMKILLVLLALSYISLGFWVYYYNPDYSGTYCISFVVLLIVGTVIYWRKSIDKSLE